MTVEFGVGLTGIYAANLCSDALAEAKQRFLECPKKHEDRSLLMLAIQRAERDLKDAVRANRGRIKLIEGDTP